MRANRVKAQSHIDVWRRGSGRVVRDGAFAKRPGPATRDDPLSLWRVAMVTAMIVVRFEDSTTPCCRWAGGRV